MVEHIGFFGGLLDFLYPWGILLQIAAIIHLIRRRGEIYWYFIIFFLGPVGGLIYILVEMLPDLGLLRQVYNRQGRKARIQIVERTVLDNPSVGNLEELGELYFEQKEYAKAKETLDRAIAARADSPHTFYLRAQSALALGQTDAAIGDLEFVVRQDPRFHFDRAAAVLARAYGLAGRTEHAEAMFGHALQYSDTPETLYYYASFLKSAGRTGEAQQWAQKIMDKKKSLPHFAQRREHAWFLKTKSLLKEMAKPKA